MTDCEILVTTTNPDALRIRAELRRAGFTVTTLGTDAEPGPHGRSRVIETLTERLSRRRSRMSSGDVHTVAGPTSPAEGDPRARSQLASESVHTAAERVISAEFDADADRWMVHMAEGGVLRTRLLILTPSPEVSVIGVGGRMLERDSGAMAFLGIALHGFPNLFFTEPPGASDFRPPITERAEAVRACAEMLRHTASTRIEARAACQHEYARLVRGGRHRPPRQARPHHFDLTVPADREAPHEYSGPALLDVPGGEIPVTVTLNGHADPIDGRYHWYGRVDGNGDLPDPGRAQVFLTVPGGTPTEGRLQERDPWGQLRIVGVGEPPFPMAAHGH